LERELTHRVGRGVRISARGRNILDIVVTGIDRIRDRTDLEIRENGHSIHKVLYHTSPPLEVIEGVVILQTHIPASGSSQRTGRTVYVTYELGNNYFATPKKF